LSVDITDSRVFNTHRVRGLSNNGNVTEQVPVLKTDNTWTMHPLIYWIRTDIQRTLTPKYYLKITRLLRKKAFLPSSSSRLTIIYKNIMGFLSTQYPLSAINKEFRRGTYLQGKKWENKSEENTII